MKGSAISFSQAHFVWHMKGEMTNVFSNWVLNCSFGKIKFQITGFSILTYRMIDHASYRECAYLNVFYEYWSDLFALNMERSETVPFLPLSTAISIDSGKEWKKVVFSMMPNVANKAKWFQYIVIFAAVFSQIETIDNPSQPVGFVLWVFITSGKFRCYHVHFSRTPVTYAIPTEEGWLSLWVSPGQALLLCRYM